VPNDCIHLFLDRQYTEVCFFIISPSTFARSLFPYYYALSLFPNYLNQEDVLKIDLDYAFSRSAAGCTTMAMQLLVGAHGCTLAPHFFPGQGTYFLFSPLPPINIKNMYNLNILHKK
jgi:hypothetical protein